MTASASRRGRRPISSSTNCASPSTDPSSLTASRDTRLAAVRSWRATWLAALASSPRRSLRTTLLRVEVEEYARIAAAEDDHWWYRNTRALVGDLLAPWLTRSQRILDAGCGPGGNGAWLAQYGSVVGVDVSPDALAFVRARRPETRPVRGVARGTPLPGRELRRRRRHHGAVHDRRRSRRAARTRSCARTRRRAPAVRAGLRVTPA